MQHRLTLKSLHSPDYPKDEQLSSCLDLPRSGLAGVMFRVHTQSHQNPLELRRGLKCTQKEKAQGRLTEPTFHHNLMPMPHIFRMSVLGAAQTDYRLAEFLQQQRCVHGSPFPLTPALTVPHRLNFHFNVANFLISFFNYNWAFQDFYYYLHMLWSGQERHLTFSVLPNLCTCFVVSIVTVLETVSWVFIWKDGYSVGTGWNVWCISFFRSLWSKV